MEEAHPQTERPSEAGYVVDAEASLVMVNHEGALRARMFQLSLDGCRVRADRYVAFPQGGVEVTFAVNGIAFRLAGTMQRIDARQTANILFSPMPARRREALQGLLDELEAQKPAQAAGTPAKAAARTRLASGGLGAPMKAGILSMPVGEQRNESPTKAASACKPAGRPMGRDRREQARHAVDTGATVFFIDSRAQISGRILDLSMSGCRIHTDERFPVGIYRRVETEFKLDGMPFRLAGVVQSLHDKFTVGIRFLDMSPRKRGQLKELMAEIEEMKQQGTGSREKGAGIRHQAPGSGNFEPGTVN